MTQHIVVMESAKSDINGPKKKVHILAYFNKNVTKTAAKIGFKSYRSKLY